MKKLGTLVAVTVALALMTGVAAAARSSVKTAASAPKKVQITDAPGDANFANDGSTHYSSAGVLPDLGNQAAPVDASAEADLLSVWFTNNASTVTAHLQTEAPPADATRISYFVATNPENYGHWGCLLFVLRLNDPAEAASRVAYILDNCGGGERVEGKHSIAQFGDGTGHLSITVPRSASPALGSGGVIASPVADARLGIGTPPVTDDTSRGTDYKLR